MLAEERCRTRIIVFSIRSHRGRPVKDHFRGGGFALGVLGQALSRVEVNFHGPRFMVLLLLHMQNCCMTSFGAFRIAGSECLGRAELLTGRKGFGSDVSRSAVRVVRHAPAGHVAAGKDLPTPI